MSEPHMIAGQWYDLDPPVVIGEKQFCKVRCEYQVPNKPNEFSVGGTPIDGGDEESFLLIFRQDRGVKVTPSAPPENPGLR